ncbi:CDP-glycerol glycerophosphotransferase family protein [Heyndrickxia coagulans]|uniref:CDP-glycerol glycerophosphotransferase family protein n=1 Tax=Heyndrickxia coagulans TaxID=1398 RepID=UPI0008F968C7|nr:CDP-glycerol glycerophosphotransferase family protein [Heyndrickxia coagulans]APB35496.1 CDP-glycerol--glycerophosphate glycerophosphotransferase [Heyndrickxia coagulans]QPG54299.1 CDP-glycerol glycerophosphotransferase family protein [Heyndrickxia coagulans]WNE62376.1 CDP-glycerol glycerophosphotransferase family protein [Heyndrickxia coagulans]
MNKNDLKRGLRFIAGPIIRYLIKDNHRRANQYAKFYDRLQIKPNTILYESRDGKSMTDSPYAIFKYMVDNPAYQHYNHIWSIQDFQSLQPVIDKYKKYPNVKFVQRNSREYLKELASCAYLINNSTFQSFYAPKKGQVYINTWHGTPLKSMGFDIPGNPAQSQNVLRNFLSADYLLSPNEHTTKMYLDSYKLEGLYDGKIIEEGYPRIDLTFHTNPNTVKKALKDAGLTVDFNKKNLLYAPTWKGKSVSKANNDVMQIISDMDRVEKEAGNEYNVFVKVHPFLYPQAAKYPELQSRLVPDYMDTNELLAATDLLITDYSSIFFDYLVTGKPILFYTWDYDVYSEERGQYLKNEDLPGPLLFSVEQLIEAIQNIETVSQKYASNYQNLRSRFTNHEDGKVTERIVQYIFDQAPLPLHIVNAVPVKKERILIYPGGMRNNGITTSFLNLMNNIDFEKYDVSCFTGEPKSKEVLNNIYKINQNVRMIFKPGVPLYRIFEVYRDRYTYNRGVRGNLGKKIFPERAYIREHTRLFGNSHFDYIIDFSGYSYYWAKYLVVADAKRKICFMHNDLLSDSEREINGKHPHRINLRGLFTLYYRFDKLVSVSKGTMEVNRKNLSRYANDDQFDYVLNSINPDRILYAEEEKSDEPKITKFKARALLSNVNDYPVWRVLPSIEGATQVSLSNDMADAEVLITAKSTVKHALYYRFHYEGKEIGWIHKKAVTLLPDSIIAEKKVNKLARIIETNNIAIWSKPFKLPGARKITSSSDFKNCVISIDQVIKTQHSTYYRFSVKKETIGWINKKGLAIFRRCTIGPETGIFSKVKILVLRKLIQTLNYSKREFLNHLDGRTRRLIDLRKPKYYKVAGSANEPIWNKPYPNYKARMIEEASNYKDAIVTVKKLAKTKQGVYALIYLKNNKIGWIHTSALSPLKRSSVVSDIEVLKIARVLPDEKNAVIWSKPYGMEGAEKMALPDMLKGNATFTIDREVTTPSGTYGRILQADGSEIGWVNMRNVFVERAYGYEVNGQYVPEPDSSHYNFVNMGRLSPEKAQANLISAFADFHKNHPKSKLYILGQGPLKTELQALILELGVSDSVFLMGQLDNPFPFMKKCDCFVLSSHYEGQPMVLLEALTLGMKIVATDIVANRTVLEDGKYGLLVEDSINGLKSGLEAMITRQHPEFEKFHYQAYNKAAMETFYRCLHE